MQAACDRGIAGTCPRNASSMQILDTVNACGRTIYERSAYTDGVAVGSHLLAHSLLVDVKLQLCCVDALQCALFVCGPCAPE